MSDCLFCKIAKKELPAEILFENDEVIAFQDIRPQAPVHILIIPKKHITSAQLLQTEDIDLIGRLHYAIPKIADQSGVSEKGYRIVTNIGFHGQQTVPHLHYHLLGGRQLQWPPG